MDIDFTLILVIAVAVTGVVWGLDAALFARARREEQREPVVVEYARSFFPVLAVVLVLRSFLAEPFTIPSGSMLPTLQIGDYIVVNKYAYGMRLPLVGTTLVPVGKPERGDIMVFRFPGKPSVNYIKRVVGLPGDTVSFREGDLFINGKQVSRKLVSQEPEVNPWEQYYEEQLGDTRHAIRQEVGRFAAGHQWEHKVPAGHYFMMGDNRDNSNDSRFWGFVPDHLIVGKAVYIWMHKEPGLHLPVFSRNGKVD